MELPTIRRCRCCGCTDDDCSVCLERTGQPCHWVEDDLCSACEPPFYGYTEGSVWERSLKSLAFLREQSTAGQWQCVGPVVVAYSELRPNCPCQVAIGLKPMDARFVALAHDILPHLIQEHLQLIKHFERSQKEKFST